MPSRSRKLSRQKKEQQQHRTELEQFMGRVEKDSKHKVKTLIEPSGKVKMSEVLEKFTDPYRDATETQEEYQTLLTIAVVAWNASFLPNQERQAIINDLFKQGQPGLPKEIEKKLRDIICELIDRKQTDFANFNRKILNFELINTGKDYHLNVASTLD